MRERAGEENGAHSRGSRVRPQTRACSQARVMHDDVSGSKIHHQASFTRNSCQPLARVYCFHVSVIFIFDALEIRLR